MTVRTDTARPSTFVIALTAALALTYVGCGDDGTTGDGGTGDGSTGDGSTGDGGTGDGSTGDGSAGDGSAGDGSAGDGSTSDGSTGDGSTGDGGTGDGGMTGPPPSCLGYCGVVIGNCTGSNAQFDSFAACMAHCGTTGAWADGNRGDTSENSLGCRTTYATRAEADPAANCAAAGPSGGNVCGSWCEVYCDQVLGNCTGDDAISFDPSCAADCADYPADAPPLASGGDSVQCRIYHSGAPAGANPGLHCPHAGPTPSAMCVDP